MKNRLIYLLPLLIALGASCTKTNDATQVTVPTGNFTGTFRVIHYNKTTGKLDTVKANLTLSMSASTGYQVGGDTTTLHAGSKGSFQLNAYYIQFNDTTYPATGVPTKNHLAGAYEYIYSGTKFQFDRTYGDTLSYQYDFTKPAI